jgi:predicted  nucleic acid-binding Zn-ribbon protein
MQKHQCLIKVCKGASEKMTKQMEAQLSEMNSRIEESQRTVIDINSQKSRLQSEVDNVSGERHRLLS